MTLRELYNKGKNELKDYIDSYSFDTMCIIELVFGVDRQSFILKSNMQADENLIPKYFQFIEQRKNGRPLQYIIGEWEFYGMPFKVGEGVLIPREDTTVLVEECLNRIKNISKPKIIDLCSGSGAVAIAVANTIKDSQVYGVELFDKAYSFLERNKELNKADNLTIIKGDVTKGEYNFQYEYFDAIVSNPPYIATNIIPSLQTEVQKEPLTALDGGNDGLYFYKKIVPFWSKYLKKGGSISFEIGEEQAEQVRQILKNNGYSDIRIIKDMAQLDRVVSGIKN